MNERTQMTNILMLSVLFGILLISGSLQCAFDCLTRNDGLHTGPSLSFSERIDSCHLSINHTAPTVSCLNKACHQRMPYQRDLGSPEMSQLVSQAQPISGTSRQPSPSFRAGSAIIVTIAEQHPQLRMLSTAPESQRQNLTSIRTTVLLC
ncbi:hypothetical protein SAMN02745165_03693 [Malonomonas rubra DSM 5091]|uniref:Uncharacterized protein n=1 Tax=Malonomonas rubra DSM 5091 TaxID=1122189 RepID=A0A1M6NS52_MALRU|nr:hypothetical protein [Malonomonas rubra]SHJ98551.1 hypothetical protein SAMN02745165_03693 [Malonomonas rubra DSM 5091]